jgi:hypothetical protein
MSRSWRAVVLALGLWTVAGAAAAYPNYLSYFNEAIGGSSQGYRYFGDCNVDLGQGYKALAAYLRERQINAIYLSAFGAVDPHDYGIRYIPIASSNYYDLPGDPLDFSRQKPVLFVISQTNRTGMYFHDHALFAWLQSRQPVRILMNSLWVYDLTGDADAHHQFAHILRGVGRRDLADQEMALAHGG